MTQNFLCRCGSLLELQKLSFFQQSTYAPFSNASTNKYFTVFIVQEGIVKTVSHQCVINIQSLGDMSSKEL